MKEEYKLSHLKELEAESIHIIREVAAEFENPVMQGFFGYGALGRKGVCSRQSAVPVDAHRFQVEV